MANVLIRFLKQEKIFVDVMMVASTVFFLYAVFGTSGDDLSYNMYAVYGIFAFLFAIRAKSDLEKKQS